MIWLLFKNCGKTKSKSTKFNEVKRTNNNSNKILKELLPKLDVFDDLDCESNENVTFVTDTHFACLSVIDTYHRIKETIPEVTKDDQDSIINQVNDLENGIETAMGINNTGRCTKVMEKHLKTLQCPFNWDLEPEMSKRNILNRIEHKYGIYNTNITSRAKFSFERFISNLMISYGLFKTNQAHDKLINIWEWLDKLDEKNERFYLSIRDGLKHIVMSTLCHVLYTLNRGQCQKLFEMITRFNSMCVTSKAAVHAIHAAVCIEIGGEALQNAVKYAKQACDLDSDTAYWHYFHSVALTAQRQYLNTYKSCPTEVEFDAIQHAIVLVNEPNPYFNFHRMNLLQNKILYYYYYYDSDNNNKIVLENSSKQIQQDFQNIIELIKAIVSMEPEDPHLIVKCAKSLMILPYFNQDNIYLTKQIIAIAVKIGCNDFTVIEAIKESIEVYRKLVDIYKEMNEKTMHTKSTNIQNHVDNIDHVGDHLDQVMNNVDHRADHGYHAVDHVDRVDHMVDKIRVYDAVQDHAINHVNQVNHVGNHVEYVVDHVVHVDHVVDHVDSVNKEKEGNNLDDDLQLIVEKHEKGSKVITDLINLNNKYDIDNRLKIMAQICSYSILFKDSEKFLVSVEKFMILISDKTIANSEIVTNHRSIFIKDHSKVFNLAELVCNEIKLIITFGNIKNPEEIQLYLDQLTKIMEVCKLKSKKVNPAFISELLDCSQKDEQSTVPQLVDGSNVHSGLQKPKQMESLHNFNKQRPVKQSSNNYTYYKAYKSKPRKRNRH